MHMVSSTTLATNRFALLFSVLYVTLIEKKFSTSVLLYITAPKNIRSLSHRYTHAQINPKYFLTRNNTCEEILPHMASNLIGKGANQMNLCQAQPSYSPCIYTKARWSYYDNVCLYAIPSLIT